MPPNFVRKRAHVVRINWVGGDLRADAQRAFRDPVTVYLRHPDGVLRPVQVPHSLVGCPVLHHSVLEVLPSEFLHVMVAQ
jgi:hypothetical protein